MLFSKFNFFKREFVDFFVPIFERYSNLKLRRNSPKKRVLLIKLDNIGDFILWTDSLQGYKKAFPSADYEITILGNVSWEQLARMTTSGFIFIFLNPDKFVFDMSYRWQMLKLVRKRSFDIVVQTRYSRRYALEEAIIKACGAPERIGFATHSGSLRHFEFIRARRWYTRLIPSSLGTFHELVRNASFVRQIGAPDFTPSLPKLVVSVEIIDDMHKTMDSNLPFSYYVLFIGSADKGKKWSNANYADIAERIFLKYGWKGVICGGLVDASEGHIICKRSNASLINLAGRTDMFKIVAIIKAAKLVITNDTMAVHMAVGLGVPSVCILGGGHFGRFLPYPEFEGQEDRLPAPVFFKMPCYGCNWHCIYSRLKDESYPCISQVSSDKVWHTSRKLIEQVSVNTDGDHVRS